VGIQAATYHCPFHYRGRVHGASNATKEAIWPRVFLEDLGFPQVSATTLHADNLGCIALTNGTVTHSHAKHIDIHHHFIHERVANSEIDLQYVSTKEMLADILMKQLPHEAFRGIERLWEWENNNRGHRVGVSIRYPMTLWSLYLPLLF
jgi:hypothetical protein